MQQMARSSVFLSGMGGLGVEIGELVCVCVVEVDCGPVGPHVML